MVDEVESTDLAPLDPTADGERFEEKIASIMAAAATELATRRYRRNALGQVAGWRRPLLAAAAIVGIASVAALATNDSQAGASQPEIGLAEAIGVPEVVANWLNSDELPQPAELVLTLEEAR